MIYREDQRQLDLDMIVHSPAFHGAARVDQDLGDGSPERDDISRSPSVSVIDPGDKEQGLVEAEGSGQVSAQGGRVDIRVEEIEAEGRDVG